MADWLKKGDIGWWKVVTDMVVVRLDWTTPSKLTLYRLVPMVFMVIGIVTDDMGLAGMGYALAALPDAFDGPLARFQTRLGAAKLSFDEERAKPFRERINLRGVTFLGSELDPLVDKIVHHAALLTLGYGRVHIGLLSASIAIAVVSTVTRTILMRRSHGESGPANIIGAWKMLPEALSVSLLVLAPNYDGWNMLANFLVATAILAAVLSWLGSLHSATTASPRVSS